MGAHKKTHCIRGHPLQKPNLVYNGEGFYECRKCKRRRDNEHRKRKRHAKMDKTYPTLPFEKKFFQWATQFLNCRFLVIYGSKCPLGDYVGMQDAAFGMKEILDDI